MPTASDELRAEFGIDDGPVIDYLGAKGFKLLPSFQWVIPHDVAMTAKDFRAIKFLCDEWDYGSWFWQYEYEDMVKQGIIDKQGYPLGKGSLG